MTRHAVCLLFAFLFAIAADAATAASVEHSLGNGLVYVRVHRLPADLPVKTEGRAPACVLDLRFVDADEDVATAFGAWLKFRGAPRPPLFILVNGGTATALLRVLRAHDPGAGVAVIGPAIGQFRPDILVRTMVADERKAYDAFENGAAIGTLLVDNPDKVRIDEESLAKENLIAPAEAADGGRTSKRPAPVVDAALQRAVHLHRSLLALKKI